MFILPAKKASGGDSLVAKSLNALGDASRSVEENVKKTAAVGRGRGRRARDESERGPVVSSSVDIPHP